MTEPTSPISVTFLRDTAHGGPKDQPQAVAQQLADFVAAATSTIDLAIYDFRLADAGLVETVCGAFKAAADRGVVVRIAYDAGKPGTADERTFALLQADPAPPGTADFLRTQFAGSAVQVKAIAVDDQLMHSKYVVRDAATSEAAVWTGSTNFTDDAWTRQENNVIRVSDQAVAAAYRSDFDQLWTTGAITGTGAGGAGETTLGGHLLGWDFCPGDGPAVDAALAQRVTDARSRIVIAAMVLTSHDVLAALSAAIDRGVAVSGIYDAGQMGPIVKEWKANPKDATVVADWEKVSARLGHKRSEPYQPTGLHNFMHLKVLITDDLVSTGSYNFSANAEHNAENQLHLADPSTVQAYADFLAAVEAAYPHP